MRTLSLLAFISLILTVSAKISHSQASPWLQGNDASHPHPNVNITIGSVVVMPVTIFTKPIMIKVNHRGRHGHHHPHSGSEYDRFGDFGGFSGRSWRRHHPFRSDDEQPTRFGEFRRLNEEGRHDPNPNPFSSNFDDDHNEGNQQRLGIRRVTIIALKPAGPQNKTEEDLGDKGIQVMNDVNNKSTTLNLPKTEEKKGNHFEDSQEDGDWVY